METARQLNRTIAHDEQMAYLGLDHYFGAGASAMDCIDVSLRAAGIKRGDVRSILDFPCGHGRVLRYLRAEFPDAEITACDLMRDGVDFCAATFGARPIYSHENFAEIALPDSAFDLIWVGSLFTHLAADRWRELLRLLHHRSLTPTGVLVFSTHGREARRRAKNKLFDYGLIEADVAAVVSAFDTYGFGYADYAEAKAYGVSLSRPDWVFQETAAAGFLIIHAAEKAWDAHHDVYGLTPAQN